MADADLVIEFVATLHELRRYKGWYRGCSLPVRKNAVTLLMYLHHHLPEDSPGMQPSELGERLKLTRPTVTTLVNSLEEHSLVERISDEEDRRVVYVRPTSQGVALVQQAKEAFAKSIEEIMDHLGPEDGRELVRITRKVREFLASRHREGKGGRD
ncbi:MAG: MarR family transcriptional regulator [Bacillota bacterium]|nr:MarR family transcriptional regulator [Bacillota bacterium]NLJ03360.1 MarR family transcriptional regulator [Bacillota bacterium]